LNNFCTKIAPQQRSQEIPEKHTSQLFQQQKTQLKKKATKNANNLFFLLSPLLTPIFFSPLLVDAKSFVCFCVGEREWRREERQMTFRLKETTPNSLPELSQFSRSPQMDFFGSISDFFGFDYVRQR
jgi:hypothetical protein